MNDFTKKKRVVVIDLSINKLQGHLKNVNGKQTFFKVHYKICETGSFFLLLSSQKRRLQLRN